MVGGVLISCLSIMIMLLFPAAILGLGMEQFREMITLFFQDYARISEQQGVASAFGGLSVEEQVEFALGLLPSTMFLAAIVLSFACYAVMGRLLRRLNYDIPKLPPFREWRLDWRLLWVLIIALLSSSLGDRLYYNLLLQIANNLLSAMLIIFLVYGITVFIWIFWRFKVAVFIRVLALLFLTQLFGGAALIAVGVLDPVFDFRRRVEKFAESRK